MFKKFEAGVLEAVVVAALVVVVVVGAAVVIVLVVVVVVGAAVVVIVVVVAAVVVVIVVGAEAVIVVVVGAAVVVVVVVGAAVVVGRAGHVTLALVQWQFDASANRMQVARVMRDYVYCAVEFSSTYAHEFAERSCRAANAVTYMYPYITR